MCWKLASIQSIIVCSYPMLFSKLQQNFTNPQAANLHIGLYASHFVLASCKYIIGQWKHFTTQLAYQRSQIFSDTVFIFSAFGISIVISMSLITRGSSLWNLIRRCHSISQKSVSTSARLFTIDHSKFQYPRLSPQQVTAMLATHETSFEINHEAVLR